MFTTIIIFIIIYVIIAKSSEKEEAEKWKIVDKVNHNERRNKLSEMPDIRIQVSKISSKEQLSEDLTEDRILTLFSYSNGGVFVKFQSGQTYTLDIERMNVCFTFNPATNCRCAEIYMGSDVIFIHENALLGLTHDWDRIFDILSLSRTTHQVVCLSIESRERAIVEYQKTLQIVNANKQIQRNMRNMRNAQKLGRFIGNMMYGG